ncbi:hypothetical protein QAD02_003099 [Eretmocerus hayati]|uniref:Uncharacterized protein n=1 Tax=Eretmocerus hayati TaxID=131215 RepID=A0ACC2NKY2_9HYME|nr:hypothetical protein QAD02_003099 [Eretmocerus hayati]
MDEKNEEKRAEYGKMTVCKLKELLSSRGIRNQGKKAELVERLMDYDRNKDFGGKGGVDDQMKERIKTPAVTLYKDLHAACPLPLFKRNDFDSFLEKYEKKVRESEKMYQRGYLLSLRFVDLGPAYFVKGRCGASMKKNVQYEVDVCLSHQGDVEGSSCECGAGWSIEAHCKHVIIILMGLLDICENKSIILEETCTEKLQTFHRPTKQYFKSPQQVKELMQRKMAPRKLDFDENNTSSTEPSNPRRYLVDHQVFEMSDEYKQKYVERFRNLLINSGCDMSMPIKMIIAPANLHAVVWDHMYSEMNLAREVLRYLKLLDVTPEEILAIEEQTRKQSHDFMWHWYRKHRLSASLFGRICRVTEKGAPKLVKDIMNPQPIYSKPIEHGRKYESTAIKTWNDYHHGFLNLAESGLFIHPQYPYICGTPDRLNAALSVLEVKCPYAARYNFIDDTSVPSLIPYLERDGKGNWALKKNSEYYYQVQGQLLVTRRSFCDFIVWTFKDLVQVSIKRDETFIDAMLKDLKKFYKNHLQPAILEKYLYRNSEKFINHSSLLHRFTQNEKSGNI